MTRRNRTWCWRLLALMALVGLSACDVRMPEWVHWPEHWDPWPHPRHRDTPREAAARQCRALAERFRVSCAHCHTTDKEDEISRADLRLTKVGRRAEIMRLSPTYGLGQDCGRCHMSGFRLNRYGAQLFVGAGAQDPATAPARQRP